MDRISRAWCSRLYMTGFLRHIGKGMRNCCRRNDAGGLFSVPEVSKRSVFSCVTLFGMHIFCVMLLTRT